MDALVYARFVAFVAVHSGLVHVYVRWMSEELPPLRDEPPSLVIVPATFLAIMAFASMYPFVRAARTHLARAAILVGFSGAAVLALALWIVAQLPSLPEQRLAFVVFVVAAEVLYGAPMFLAVALLAKMLSPVLVAAPAHRLESASFLSHSSGALLDADRSRSSP